MGNNCQIRKVHKESSINYSFHAEKYAHGFVSFGTSRFYIFTLELHHQFKLKLKHFIGQPWKAALPKYKHITNTHIDTIRKWNESKQNEQKPWYQARRESHTYVSVMHATCTGAVLRYLCHINVTLGSRSTLSLWINRADTITTKKKHNTSACYMLWGMCTL